MSLPVIGVAVLALLVEPHLHAAWEIAHIVRAVCYDALERIRVIHVESDPLVGRPRHLLIWPHAPVPADPYLRADVQLFEPGEPPPRPERTCFAVDDHELPSRCRTCQPTGGRG